MPHQYTSNTTDSNIALVLTLTSRTRRDCPMPPAESLDALLRAVIKTIDASTLDPPHIDPNANLLPSFGKKKTNGERLRTSTSNMIIEERVSMANA